MQKLYCYVDESGQDTKGKLFLVSVIIQEKEREELRAKLELIERESKKGIRKWFHSNRKRRELYIKKIIENRSFQHQIFYSKYEDTKAYIDLTILATAKVILQKTKEPYSVVILVDGLDRRGRYNFAAGLRRLKIKVRKVRGVRDQSDAFIRLADAVAGFVRDYLEGDKIMKKLYEDAIKRGMVEPIWKTKTPVVRGLSLFPQKAGHLPEGKYSAVTLM